MKLKQEINMGGDWKGKSEKRMLKKVRFIWSEEKPDCEKKDEKGEHKLWENK